MQRSTVNGTELGAQEWRDALFLRYGLEAPDLPTHCDGCQAKFSISHALDCKKGGLITAHHNEIRDGVADLAGKAFTPTHVRDDPLIFSGRAVKRTNAEPARQAETATTQKCSRQRSRNRRVIFLSGTSSNRGQTVFTTCVL